MVRYRFSQFTLSPQRRLLIRDGREVPLIPRYFDLLVLLIERRHQAVHRREIFECVWADAVVSESALSQAVRTIRSTLGDDSRDPRFIRTVSRHGYQFVFAEVIEEEEVDAAPAPALPATGDASVPMDTSATRTTSTGWTGAAAGGAVAGIVAGGLGGLILAAAPGSTAPIAIAPVLAAIGAGCGGLGGLGVGAAIASAERTVRSHRTLALTFTAALGGGIVGLTVQWLTRWGLAALIGLDVHVGGGVEGVLIGGAVGLGLAVSTTKEDEAVRWRWTRARGALITALCCGLAGLALTLAGRPLAGGTIHAIADAAEGSSVTLAPLGRLMGEPDFGPLSQAILAFGEAAVFGVGVALGWMEKLRTLNSELRTGERP
ncbi:MAG TPA: winged helix-turn-helix domain-containing protein [Vicinamibacterales bacterium]